MNFMRNIGNAIKFFISPLGMIVGFILLIVLIIILIAICIRVAGYWFDKQDGIVTYSTFQEDWETIEPLIESGYANLVNTENLRNFRTYEYAVLMDAAEYIRHGGQDNYDVTENQGVFQKERDYYSKNCPSDSVRDSYLEALEKLQKPGVVKLLSVESQYDQGSEDNNTPCIEAAKASGSGGRNGDFREYHGVQNKKTTLGGNNRTMGPYLVYEFKVDSGDTVFDALNDPEAATVIPSGGDPSATVPGRKTMDYVFIGDSRFSDMKGAVGSKPNNKNWLAKSGWEYDDFMTAMRNGNKKLEAKTYIWNLGVNDGLWFGESELQDAIKKYSDLLTKLSQDHAIYVVSVNPVYDPGRPGNVLNNKGISEFNKAMKQLCDSNPHMLYVDTYNDLWSEFNKSSSYRDPNR